jgi:hypothetical protein
MVESKQSDNSTRNKLSLNNLIGRSQNGAKITDITPSDSQICDLALRFTVKFANNYREPKRFYWYEYDSGSWSCMTPDMPEICESVLSQMESKTVESTNTL